MNDVSAELRAIADKIDRHIELRTLGKSERQNKDQRNACALNYGFIAEKMYKARRDREKALGVPGLFSDPAWDILLDLMINENRLKRVAVTSACIASCVPPTTALRWLSTLEEYGLIERVQDAADARRTYVSLTKIGRAKVRAAIAPNVEITEEVRKELFQL